MWLLIAVTLDRLSFAFGTVLARTWRPTVRRQPGSCVLLLLFWFIGTITKPRGRIGMQDGSSPLIAS